MGVRCVLLALLLDFVNSDSPSFFGEITSPNYPQGYPNYANQSWDIQVPDGYGIRLYFIHLDIEPSDGCEYDSLQVIIGGTVQETLCGRGSAEDSGKPMKERYYPSTKLKLLFTSDFSNQERYIGFSAYYIAVDVDECEEYSLNPCSHFCNNYIGGFFCSCPPEYDLQEDQHTCGVNCSGSVYTELRGLITSPGYPSPYPENSRCEYKVLLEPGYQVIITFMSTDFDVEIANDGSCYDSLTISAKGRYFGPFCGKGFPPRIETHSNEVDIIFQTDSGGDNKGWKIIYSEDAIPCPTVITEHSTQDPLQDKYTFKDTVMVRCEQGYEILFGDKSELSFFSKCQGDGKWSNSHLKCQPVDCGDPEPIDDGEVLFDSTTYESEAKYICSNEYYTLSEEGTYRCSLDGHWVNSKTGQKDLPKCNPVCGKNMFLSTSRIYGGAEAQNGYFPWVVRVNQPSLGGGALISDRWVLTAAHVVDNNQQPAMRAGDVRLGNAKILQGKKVILHPKWEKNTKEDRLNFDNDIALVLLDKKVIMGPCICPVCLPEKGEKTTPALEEIGYVAGWGKTSDTDEKERTNVLQYVSIPVRETKDCKESLETKQAFTENMMCAGGMGKDSCTGDSGGPLMFQDLSAKEEDKRLYIGGIVSWGVKCGAFGMYTKVKNYLDWIKETIRNEEEKARGQKIETVNLCQKKKGK